MDEVYVSLLNIISQEVVPHFNMFGSRVKHRIFGNTNGTRAVYVIQSSWEQQLAAATYSASVVD
jgi:hypothetical protein